MTTQLKTPRRCSNTYGATDNCEELIGMSKRTCSVESCGHPHYAKGYCNRHYIRVRKYGTPGGGRTRYTDPREGFKARTRRQGDCIVWTGPLTDSGYARFRVHGVKVYAHRWAWEQENGPAPEGMDVDHACHNRACVNPRHLRLASREQNGANRCGGWNSLGVRNVHKLPSGSYRVAVGSPPRRVTQTFATLAEATSAAAQIRAEVFGEFAGRG